MKDYYILLIIFFLIVVGTILEKKVISPRTNYVVVGTANPGEIMLYTKQSSQLQFIKKVDTKFQYVYTVRIGDIYNDGSQAIIAGVSNSFYDDNYGCQIITYDLNLKHLSVIDTIEDLRCKDLTIGDANNDGETDIILGTHGQGLIHMYSWINGAWKKEQIDKNFIAAIDQEEGTNHRVPNEKLPCSECIIQSAVHIVKIVDLDEDGANEIIATISSPLELKDINEISFVVRYQKQGDIWKKEIIDRQDNIEFRSIEVGDIYHNGKKILVIGTGSPRDITGSVYTYYYDNNKWVKQRIYNDPNEKNMKGLAMSKMQGELEKVVIGTGFPNAKILIMNWNNNTFETSEVIQITHLISKSGQYNIMSTLVDEEGDILTGGMTTFPDKNIGWEASDQGFITLHRLQDNKWHSTVISQRNILGMDLSD